MLLFVIFIGPFVFVFTDFLCFLYRTVPFDSRKTLSLKGKNKGKLQRIVFYPKTPLYQLYSSKTLSKTANYKMK